MSPPDLVLWRHGRTEWSADGRFQGQTDVPLDEYGRHQILAAAEVLAARGPSRIVSSDLRRAVDTAGALSSLAGLPVEVDERLREVDVGAWAGLSFAEVALRFPAEAADWLAGKDLVRSGSSESYSDVGERAWACLSAMHASAPKDAGPVVAVTHGGTSLSLVARALGLPLEMRRRFGPIGNAHWTRLAPYGDGWQLAEHNVGVPARVAPKVASE